MSAEARQWLAYAVENRQVAALSRENGLYNPSLQNAQQAVEKALKAIGLLRGVPLKKTHSIGELRRGLLDIGLDPGLTGDALGTTLAFARLGSFRPIMAVFHRTRPYRPKRPRPT